MGIVSNMYDDIDISILSSTKSAPQPKIHVIFDKEVEDQKTASLPGGYNKRNPILVDSYYIDDDDDDDLKRAISASLEITNSSNRKSKREEVELVDHDFVGIRNKMFKGESSSNSKSHVIDVDDDAFGVVDPPIITFMCDICVDEKPISVVFRIQGCNHSYCSDCIAKYVASKLQENIKDINCPVMRCRGKLDPQYCSSILPRQVFDRWGDALCEEMILASEKFYCPFKDCSALLINDSSLRGVGGVGGRVNKVLQSECPYCHRLFCAQCKVAWHSEVSSCEEFQKLNKDEREREDILMMKLAKSKRWNRCPRCRFCVEKISGCSFVLCRCGHTFNYQ